MLMLKGRLNQTIIGTKHMPKNFGEGKENRRVIAAEERLLKEFNQLTGTITRYVALRVETDVAKEDMEDMAALYINTVGDKVLETYQAYDAPFNVLEALIRSELAIAGENGLGTAKNRNNSTTILRLWADGRDLDELSGELGDAVMAGTPDKAGTNEHPLFVKTLVANLRIHLLAGSFLDKDFAQRIQGVFPSAMHHLRSILQPGAVGAAPTGRWADYFKKNLEKRIGDTLMPNSLREQLIFKRATEATGQKYDGNYDNSENIKQEIAELKEFLNTYPDVAEFVSDTLILDSPVVKACLKQSEKK